MSMKKNSFKRQLAVVVCMLLCGLSIQAADDGLITDQIVINKLEAGTLPQRISSDEKNLITNLKINGEINGTDLRFIREMAGQSADGYKTKGNLSVLDLSDVKIVSGGDYYYSQRAGILETYYTKDDEIGFCAFSNCSGLTRLFLPSTITSIGHFAFENCSGLTSMTLPPSLTSIGGNVFYGCSRLASLTVPSTLSSVEKSAFSNISVSDFRYIIYGDLATYVQRGQPYISLSDETNAIKYYYNGQELTNLKIPSSVTSIGNYAFAYCRDLKNMTLPSGVTSIGDCAFKCCSGLASLTLPSGVSSIGDHAFKWCSGLTSVTFPSSLTSMGEEAFDGCRGLTRLSLPPNLATIGWRAFCGCSGLTSVTFPSSLTSIGSEAFISCSGLASLSLPPNLASIGYEVFRYCSGLTSVTLPSSLTSIDPCAFKGCSGLTSLTLPYKLTSIGEEAFCGCSSLTNLALSPSLTRIGEGAFNGCFNLSTLTIPSSLTSISKLNNKLSETPLFTSAFVTVYVAWQTPIPAGDFFCNFELWGCKLYVPKGTKQVYLQSEVWKDFGNIQEYDVTDITKVDNNSETKEVSWYSLDGQRLASPTKGINIVRYSDGSIKKEIVE